MPVPVRTAVVGDAREGALTSLTRRQVSIAIAGAALFVASGCAAFRRESELDAAIADLESILQAIGSDNDDELVAIAEKISEQAQSLREAHEDFASEFNRQAANREVSKDTLAELVRNYDAGRLALRNELLRSQDELHLAVPEDSWPEVLEVLNRKGRAVMPRRAREA